MSTALPLQVVMRAVVFRRQCLLKKMIGQRNETVHSSVERLKSHPLASHPAATDSRSSGIVTKPPTKLPEPAYSPYNYPDTIPKPKVIYIRNEENANEIVGRLNG